MRYLLRFSVLALALAAIAAGCGGGGSGSVPKGVVAVVGNDEITRAEFDALLAQAERGYKLQRREFPKAGSQEYRALQDRAIEFLVQRSEFEQKAQEFGIVISDKQVEERLERYKKQYFGGSDQQYQKQLRQQGLTDEEFRDSIRGQLISERIFQKVVASITVSDAEIEDYYKLHPQQYTTPKTRQVRHILVKSKALADKIYAQLKSGANFAALAKKHSTDPGSRSLGGKLTISQGQTVKPFDGAAFALKTGEISKPVKTQYGWHVIWAEKPAKPRQSTPLERVKGSIRQLLLQQKRSGAMTKWVEDVGKEFCAGELSFATGFTPNPDPCAKKTGTTATTPTAP